jgi:transmembrane sensor
MGINPYLLSAPVSGNSIKNHFSIRGTSSFFCLRVKHSEKMTSKENTDFILKFLSNDPDDIERERFESWLKESADNQKYFEQVKILWNRLSKSYDSLAFDEAAAKKSIITKIQRHESKARVLRARYRISAAASVLLLLGLGYLGYIKTRDFAESPVLYGTAGNHTKEIVLPDSSHVWLNKNSSLYIMRHFNQRQRNTVLEGEAFFEVTRDETRPFRVYAGKTVTSVLGTSFNLNAVKDEKVSLTVHTGRVGFFRKGIFKRGEICSAGEKADFIYASGTILRSANDNPNFLAWKTKILTFNNTPLAEVCVILSKHYQVTVKSVIPDEQLSLTGTFQDESLDDIISTIELTFDIKSKNEDEMIILYQ